jgi:hypothetical protein
MVLTDKGLLSGQWTEQTSKQRQDFERQQLELMGGRVAHRFVTEDEIPTSGKIRKRRRRINS